MNISYYIYYNKTLSLVEGKNYEVIVVDTFFYEILFLLFFWHFSLERYVKYRSLMYLSNTMNYQMNYLFISLLN